jgi:hypothetical protein
MCHGHPCVASNILKRQCLNIMYATELGEILHEVSVLSGGRLNHDHTETTHSYPLYRLQSMETLASGVLVAAGGADASASISSHHNGGDVGSLAVRISTPVSFTNSVCSNCAEGCPSFVTAVQPSAQCVSCVPGSGGELGSTGKGVSKGVSKGVLLVAVEHGGGCKRARAGSACTPSTCPC